jgi:hypothetical protein
VSLFTESVTLRLRGVKIGEDDYGNDVFGPPQNATWPAWYEPRESGEQTAAREQVSSGYWLFLPLDAPLSAADVVILEGQPYEVVGEPGRQPGGFTLDGYQKAALERVTG